MARTTLREDEWLAELTRLSQRNDRGLTTQEWGDKLGRTQETVRKLLRKAQALGWLVIGERTGINLRGRACNYTVYSITKPKARR
jgi:CRP-like cAMP-binding protein